MQNRVTNKKSIAIATLTKNPNYGNVLQNIAMQRICEKRGCTAQTIINRTSSTLFLSGSSAKIKRAVNFILNRNNTRKDEKRRRRFLACCRQNISYSTICYDNGFSKEVADSYDMFIAGSDQIWNPWFGAATSFEFLGFAPEDRIMTYAASFGISEFGELPEARKAEMISYIKRFKSISCREKSGTDFILKNTGVPVCTHVDPTMLIDKEEWRSMEKKPSCQLPERFVFVYMLGELNERYRQTIERKAGRLDAEILNILDDRFLTLDPLEFLWLIDHSLFVCTDSFHACVFSVLFHRGFTVFDRIDSQKNQNSRFETLLEKMNISAEAVMMDCGGEPSGKVDWERVDARLDAERKAANEYLDSYIS